MVITYKDIKPRYNIIGEWKPLTYVGDMDALRDEVNDLTKNEHDKRIYGAMFYIKATSYPVIEFIVKTHFEIPTDFQQISSPSHGKILLHKVSFPEEYSNLENIQIYDGTLELIDTTVEDIKNGLTFIDILLNRLAFRIDTKIEWIMKYPHHSTDPANTIHLTDDDMNLLGEYLLENLKGDDSVLFDVAIGWYVNGNNSNNIYIKFLSYCIAMEALVDNFLYKKMEVSSKYDFKEIKMDEDDISECIKMKHDELYSKDPKEFVNVAYFECIKGIKKKMKMAMSIVFGEEHAYLDLFFKKVDKNSIYDLRSQLAHGSLNIFEPEHKEMIESRLQDIKEIAYNFITRLSTGTPKDQKPKKINSQRSIVISFMSPRGTGIANNLNMFSNKDWKIKPEWLF